MFILSFILLTTSDLFWGYYCLESSQVKCNTGTYRGAVTTTSSGVNYTAFLGIKFADVVERFKVGEPVRNDSSAKFNATEFGPICYQKDMSDQGSEDCLYLNIYSPDVNGSLPVLFYIYGGAFVTGSTHSYDPEYFMETGRIVVVTAAYRVGPFGFLYFDDPEFPANLGLRDQILGLRWVQQNIAAFGGEPSKVTINGQSAGAASANILMHSPLAKGLFVGAISESGTACAPWALQPRCTGLHKLRLLATNTGCDGYLPEAIGRNWSAKKLAECLRKLSPKEMIDAVDSFPKWELLVPFPPIVENKNVAEPVITVFPWLKTGDSRNLVPWISGTNSGEAAVIVRKNYPNDTLESLALRIFNGFILSDFLYYRYTSRYPIVVTADIKLHFFKDYLLNFETFISKISSIGFFYYPNYQCLLTDLSPSYAYFFNYKRQSARGIERELVAQYGVGHGGELAYIWKQSFNIRKDGTKFDAATSRNLVKAWIDFASYQSANYSNVTWERYDRRKNRFLIIDEKGASMQRNPNRQTNHIWRGLATNLYPVTVDCSSTVRGFDLAVNGP